MTLTMLLLLACVWAVLSCLLAAAMSSRASRSRACSLVRQDCVLLLAQSLDYTISSLPIRYNVRDCQSKRACVGQSKA